MTSHAIGNEFAMIDKRPKPNKNKPILSNFMTHVSPNGGQIGMLKRYENLLTFLFH